MVTLKDSIQVKVTNDVVVTLSRTKGLLFDETMCQVFSITCLNKEILEQIKDAKIKEFFLFRYANTPRYIPFGLKLLMSENLTQQLPQCKFS